MALKAAKFRKQDLVVMFAKKDGSTGRCEPVSTDPPRGRVAFLSVQKSGKQRESSPRNQEKEPGCSDIGVAKVAELLPFFNPLFAHHRDCVGRGGWWFGACPSNRTFRKFFRYCSWMTKGGPWKKGILPEFSASARQPWDAKLQPLNFTQKDTANQCVSCCQNTASSDHLSHVAGMYVLCHLDLVQELCHLQVLLKVGHSACT